MGHSPASRLGGPIGLLRRQIVGPLSPGRDTDGDSTRVRGASANRLPFGPLGLAGRSYNPAVAPPPRPPTRVVLAAPGLPDPVSALGSARDGDRAFLRLAKGPGHRGTAWSFLGLEPAEILSTRRTTASSSLAKALAPLRPQPVRHVGPKLPFAGGWAGFLGYEARSGVERTPRPRSSPLGFPVWWLGRYEAVAAWNHRTGERFVAGTGPTRRTAEGRARDLRRRLEAAPAIRGAGPSSDRGAPRPKVEAAAYRRAVRAARAAVLRGDIFQANVSQRFDMRRPGTAFDLFRKLTESQPAPYMTYVDIGDGRAVVSASPERFLRIRGRMIETDPMKGTRPRGGARAEDRALKQELERSEKDKAELAMIVDLSRNDLARVCDAGTVRVTVPRRLIPFARVHQAIAVVRGRLAAGHDRVDALQAAFPPGSVTGAPKVRAMEIIDELEGEGRGPYCGALGWFDDAGGMDLAVAIRTILVTRATASYRVGGGITLGSDPHDEWRETLDKGRGLYHALCGREDAT